MPMAGISIFTPPSRRRIGRFIQRLTFNNRSFWNSRYELDPDLGSGPGSRNEHLILKNTIVRDVIRDFEIRSIVDIGCGDLAVLRDVDVQQYLGIDISQIVVERNKQLRPSWSFLCADIAEEYMPPRADLVLCFDVLIHQKSKQRYRTILSKVLSAAEKIVLISGCERPSEGWNVFFHEPLSTSIARICPKARIEKLAKYRDTHLLRIIIEADRPGTWDRSGNSNG